MLLSSVSDHVPVLVTEPFVAVKVPEVSNVKSYPENLLVSFCPEST
ncbi:hypothetical protein [Winogradskyella sp.]|nr:hypothetical protein [Winogradskyella sp.]